MQLTNTQRATLKAAIIADPVAGPIRAAGDTASLKAWCNGDSTNVVWRTITSGDVVRNAILWANMTPLDTPDITVIYTNRALYAQAKQISLQTMVQGQEQIASGVSGIRVGLQDSLTNLPTGALGANIGAGWTAVRTAMQRFATRCESLFTLTQGTGATPVDLVFEGLVGDADANVLVN